MRLHISAAKWLSWPGVMRYVAKRCVWLAINWNHVLSSDHKHNLVPAQRNRKRLSIVWWCVRPLVHPSWTEEDFALSLSLLLQRWEDYIYFLVSSEPTRQQPLLLFDDIAQRITDDCRAADDDDDRGLYILYSCIGRYFILHAARIDGFSQAEVVQ